MPKPYTVDAALLARRKIYQAVLEAEDRSDFPSLSVTALCVVAGVPRSTFYRHFTSIDNFVWRFLDDAIDDMMTGMPTRLSLYQAILLQCTKLAGEDLPYRRIFHLAGQPLITRIAQERTKKHLTDLVLQAAPEMLDEELRFEIDAVSQCLPPMLIKWAAADPPRFPAAFASKALSVIPERLLGIAGNAFL